MKWYAYPLAIVAWLLVAVFIFIFSWNYIGDAETPEWAWWLLIIAASFLIVSFVLSKLKMSWELDGFIQVAFVLGPLLWYLNQKEPYKTPEYVFLIEAGFEGEAKVSFTTDDNTKTQVHVNTDSLFFRFDGSGEILVNEDFRTVRDAIRNRFYFLYPDGSRKQIHLISKGDKPSPDSTRFVAYEDTIVAEKGNIRYISWMVSRADRVK